MEKIEAKILFKNLLGRISTLDDGSKQLPGVLTDDEITALEIALALFTGPDGPVAGIAALPQPAPPAKPMHPIPEYDTPTDAGEAGTGAAAVAEDSHPKIDLDASTLALEAPPSDVRLCLDFGTAMSKATLVRDGEGDSSEEIHVLQLGIPGDQEEISDVMLISSVYIDNEGLLWFGNAAVNRSMLEAGDGSRQRLDNIKRRLSEDGWGEEVGSRFNPTEIKITYADMVLGYLMFLTWAVNSCLVDLKYPLNLSRRFAMPCLAGEKGRETAHRLRRLIGEAQVLADTFFTTLKDGIPLGVFMKTVKELRQQKLAYPFVADNITEPLGVAGSFLSWESAIDHLVMVIDVGAGTSDLSLFRINFDPASGSHQAIEIQDSSRGLTEAGNHLDQILIELILSKSEVTSEDPLWVNIRSELTLQIRDFKETLFNAEYLFVTLMNGIEVELELEEFLSLDAVKAFGDSLMASMVEILESIDQSWVNWVRANPRRNLVVALTGGGAELPMVQNLAAQPLSINGHALPVVRALRVPKWLADMDANLEDDYPRVAVSLGGARKRLFEHEGTAKTTAGDDTSKRVYDDPKYQW